MKVLVLYLCLICFSAYAASVVFVTSLNLLMGDPGYSEVDYAQVGTTIGRRMPEEP
jgi:hypothetical protein